MPLKLVHPNGNGGGGGAGSGNNSPSSPIGRKSPNFEVLKSAKDRSRTFQVHATNQLPKQPRRPLGFGSGLARVWLGFHSWSERHLVAFTPPPALI